jgi:hypothetical protein
VKILWRPWSGVAVGKPDVARKAADNARGLVVAANEEFGKALAMARRQVDGLGMISGPPTRSGGAPAGTTPC